MRAIHQTTIINALNELSIKIDVTEKTKKRNQWISYGLAASSSLMFLFAVVIPNKFDIAKICVKATCEEQQSYKLIKSVYDREKEVNIKGFGRKTEIQGVIHGNEILIKFLAVLGTLGLGAAYISHKKQTRALVALKQQRYEMSRLVAFWVNGNVKAYLEVSVHNFLVEKQARIDERLEIDQIERANRYRPHQLNEFTTKYQGKDEIKKLQYERQVTDLNVNISNIDSLGKQPQVTSCKLPQIEGITFFDWDWFTTKEYDLIPHIRLVGSTGVGKTLLADFILDKLPGEKKVWTIKRKPHQWLNKTVVGYPEDWERLEIEFQKLAAERKERLQDVANGIEPEIINIALDEFRGIKNRMKMATEFTRDTLTFSKEARQRLILIAENSQLVTFGLKGDEDLEDCILTVFIGAFARGEARSYYNKTKDICDESKTLVLEHLENFGNRACWIHSSFGDYPAIAPTIEVYKIAC